MNVRIIDANFYEKDQVRKAIDIFYVCLPAIDYMLVDSEISQELKSVVDECNKRMKNVDPYAKTINIEFAFDETRRAISEAIISFE